jgi:hypothetical protein
MHHCPPSTIIVAPVTKWRTRFLLVLGILVLSAQFSNAGDTKRNLTVYSEDVVMPHLADGDGWTTTITLVNLDSTDAPFQLSFLDNNGHALTIPFLETGDESILSGTIPFRGTVTLHTTGTSDPLKEGWAFVSSNQLIGGMAVFSFHRPGVLDFESVVPFTSYLDLQQVLAFDHRDGFLTGLAMANFLASPITVRMQFVDENGVALFSDTVNLPAGGHTSFLLSDRYPQLEDKRGTIQFSEQSGLVEGLTVMGLRFTPDGPFTTIFPMRAPYW